MIRITRHGGLEGYSRAHPGDKGVTVDSYSAERQEISDRIDYIPHEFEMLRPTELVPILDAWAYCGYVREDHVPEILGQLCVWVEGYEHHRTGWYLCGQYRGRNDWMNLIKLAKPDALDRRTWR